MKHQNPLLSPVKLTKKVVYPVKLSKPTQDSSDIFETLRIDVSRHHTEVESSIESVYSNLKIDQFTPRVRTRKIIK